MSCLSAFQSQIAALLLPQEIILLQHKVFREYAKTAVGPDFIHTFPSILILIALVILFWKNPPTIKWIHENHNEAPVYKSFQMLLSWLSISLLFWLWLVIQRVIYCSVWSNWSYDTEYREFVYPWWQRVWSSYYPQPLRPPLFSAGFISWILAMILSVCIFGCAVSIELMKKYLSETSAGINELKLTSKTYLISLSNKLQKARTLLERETMIDESEINSLCDACRSEISTDGKNHLHQQNVLPVCNGTDWYSLATQRKNSLKSMRTSKTITGECPEGEDASPRILRHRRGCHTVPSTCSDKSSLC